MSREHAGWAGFALILAALALVPFLAGRGALSLGIEILVIIALAQAWNLLAGYGGLLSLGHHGFVGLGGYALFTVTRDLPVSPYLMVPLAALITATLALALAPILFRLRDVYFAVGMWVAAEIIRILIMRWEFTGAASGMPLYAARGLDRAWMGPITFWLALAVAGGITLTVALMVRGTFGLRLRALRDDETAARSIGVGPWRVRLIVFLVSAAGAGAAGAVSFLSNLFITPMAAFDIGWTVTVIFVTVIGGIGRLHGPVLGALVYFALREWLAFSAGWSLVALGVTAMAVMLFTPGGLAGLADRLLRRFSRPETAP